MFWTDRLFPEDLEEVMEDEEYKQLFEDGNPPFDESFIDDEMGF